MKSVHETKYLISDFEINCLIQLMLIGYRREFYIYFSRKNPVLVMIINEYFDRTLGNCVRFLTLSNAITHYLISCLTIFHVWIAVLLVYYCVDKLWHQILSLDTNTDITRNLQKF